MEDTKVEELAFDHNDPRQESPPCETIPANVTENIEQNQLAEHMETHAHELHKAPGHGWGHYLFEFFMLFFAVFCGFLAEYELEHIIENQKGKEYILSMIEDLQTDTLNLSDVHQGYLRKEQVLDTVITGFDEGVHSYSPAWARNFLKSYRTGFPDFYYTDRTIQQLKNSGGMRLIKDKVAADGIINYDTEMRDLEFEETFVSKEQENYINEVLKVWSVKRMYQDVGVHSFANNRTMVIKSNYWITKDPVDFERLFNRLSEYNEALIRHGQDFIDKKGKATQLIALLKSRYHIE